MSKNFNRANLGSHSFIGQDFRGVDFSYADIRGANFTNAILIGANFSHVKAGLRIWWSMGLALTSIFLAVLAGFISGYAAAFSIYVQNLPAQYNILERQVLPIIAIGVLALLLAILLRRGLGATLAAFALILAISIVLIAAAGDVVIVATTLLLTLSIAAAIGGVVLGAIAVALSFGMLQTWLMAIVAVVALAGTVPGAQEGVSRMTEQISFAEFALVGIIAVILLIISGYIGQQAMRGDEKYALIRTLTITLLTKGGTSFHGADLTDALFTQAVLKHADLRAAVLTRTDWFEAKQLARARTEGTYLADPNLQKLVTSKDGHNKTFDNRDMRGLNLQSANLTDASLIGANLSEATLMGADLSRAKLVHTQLYATNLHQAYLTGAYIEDWGISTDTHLDEIKCDYIYMRLPTQQDPDPCRKPDNRHETFKEGDFSDFIAPIIKTLALYRQQHMDLRNVGKAFKTMDIFHYDGVDPIATVIALKQLAQQNPEAGLEVVAVQGRGEDKIRLQANVSEDADPSRLSAEYLAHYNQIKSLSYNDLQVLLAKVTEKDNQIQSLENMVMAAIKSEKFYAETYYNFGEIKSEKGSIQIEAGGNINKNTVITGNNNVVGDRNITATELNGPVNTGDEVHQSQTEQTIDHQVNTGGGVAIEGDVNTEGDFVGRDKVA